jgi:hypothetical protein
MARQVGARILRQSVAAVVQVIKNSVSKLGRWFCEVFGAQIECNNYPTLQSTYRQLLAAEETRRRLGRPEDINLRRTYIGDDLP